MKDNRPNRNHEVATHTREGIETIVENEPLEGGYIVATHTREGIETLKERCCPFQLPVATHTREGIETDFKDCIFLTCKLQLTPARGLKLQ